EAAGRVDIYPASTCARVVASGGCAPNPPPADPLPAGGPQKGRPGGGRAGTLRPPAPPPDLEASHPPLRGGAGIASTPCYMRYHFQIPSLEVATFRLAVGGLVDRPLSLSMDDMRKMPSQTMVVTLECAGNGRALFEPAINGEQWNLGAVSTAEWTGVPLTELLDRVGVRNDAREVLFRGADLGLVDGHSS